MADLKISQLTDGGASQAADEYVVARSGSNFRIDGASVAAAATSVGTLTSLTVSGDVTISKSVAAGSVIASVVNTSATGAARIYLGNDGSASAGRLQIFGSTHAVRPGIMAIGTDANLPLVFDTNGTEKMRLDASGNLGIGVTPSFDLEVTKSKPSNTVDLMVKNTGTTGTSNARLLVYVDSTSGGDPKMGVGITAVRDYFWYIDNSDSDKLKLSDSGTDILEIIDGSSLALKGASSASGTGITFPATQSASSDANTLDDYEEGTWTPTIYGQSSTGTTTYTSQSGHYTKIGRQVTARLQVSYSAATGTGNLLIGGFPFSSASIECIGSVMTSNMDAPNAGSYAIYMTSGTVASLYSSTDNAALAIFTLSNESAEVWATVTYFV